MKYNAYDGDESFKQELILRAKEHQKKDEYIAGTYGYIWGHVFKGCSVGCSINDVNEIKNTSGRVNNHSFLAEQLGVPLFICRLQDTLFERLPSAEQVGWTPRFFQAINTGADLTPVLPLFLKFILSSVAHVIDGQGGEQQKAFDAVNKVINTWVDTGNIHVHAANTHANTHAVTTAANTHAVTAAVARVAASYTKAFVAEAAHDNYAAHTHAKAIVAVVAVAEAAHDNYDAHAETLADEFIRLITNQTGNAL